MPDFPRDLFETVEITPDLLEALFGKEENYGVVEEDTGDGALFPSGERWATCTSWANYCARAFGKRAETYGFGDEENPTSEVADLYGGHDFSCIDGRWLVDGWLREVAGMSDRIVFDLENPEDATDIAKFYGVRTTWSESGITPDLESDHQRSMAMSSCRFADILEAHTKPGLSFS